jgi:hypothetical protein
VQAKPVWKVKTIVMSILIMITHTHTIILMRTITIIMDILMIILIATLMNTRKLLPPSKVLSIMV